jgi:hypothetical protein
VVVDGVLPPSAQARAGLDTAIRCCSSCSTAWRRSPAVRAASSTRLTEGFLVLATQVDLPGCPARWGRCLDALLPDELRAARRAGPRPPGLPGAPEGRRLRLADHPRDLTSSAGRALHTCSTRAGRRPDSPATPLPGPARAGGDVEAALPRPRSLDQQRHDALRNGLRRYLDSGIAGLRDKVAPHLSVTVGLDSLHAAPAACRPSPPPAPGCPAAWSGAGGATAPSPASCSASAARSWPPATPAAPSPPPNAAPSGSRPAAAARSPAAPADQAAARPAPPDPVRRVRHHQPDRHRPALRQQPPRPARRTQDPAPQGRTALGPTAGSRETTRTTRAEAVRGQGGRLPP